MNQTLLIIGPDIKLRGVGGVTIHVRRLLDYLDNVGYKYDFKDYKSISLWELYKEMRHHRIVHIHISNPLYQFIVVLLARLLRAKAIVTLHGNYGRFGVLKNCVVKLSIKIATIPIVINEKSYEACKQLNEKTILIPAFIPPHKEDPLPQEVVDVLEELHRKGKKVFTTNASNMAVDKFGNDIYGIDFLVQYFKDSRDRTLVISDPSGKYRQYYQGLNSSNIFFINKSHSYYEVLKRADYSVRNTSTDGDSLSVKESLYLGVPALCTDVVNRPKGVRLFKYCDKSSFEKCISEENGETEVLENGAEQIVKVYKCLAE